MEKAGVILFRCKDTWPGVVALHGMAAPLIQLPANVPWKWPTVVQGLGPLTPRCKFWPGCLSWVLLGLTLASVGI